MKDGKGKANDEGQLKSTVAGELAYDDMMKRAREGKTGSISMDDLNVGVMDENSEVTSDNVLDWMGAQYKKVKKKVENSPTYKKIRKEVQKIQDNPIGYAKSVGEQRINHAVHNLTVAKNTLGKGYNNVVGFITGENKNVTRSKNSKLDADTKRSENERNNRDKQSQNNFIAETKNKSLKKKSTKKSPPKGKKTPVHKTKKEQEKEFIEHMNSITQGYYKYEPEHLKIGAKVGTQAFFWSNQNVKIGDGSNIVSNETLAKAASSTIGQAVASGYYKLIPTEDKKYENDNPHVQKQVKAAKAEAKRRTAESKDKDYYARVDGKNKTVTVEESNRPKGYGSYLFRDVILNPLQSGNNFFNAGKSLLSGDLGGAFKNTVTGVGNLFSPFTLGIGSWAGDNYARFKPEEVQYGTREEVLKRKQTENLLVSTPIDMAVGYVTSKILIKKIIPTKSKNPVTRTTTTESRATRKGATVLEEGSESIGNINNRTHSSLNNLHRSTGEKSYTLNSEKSNWNFNSEISKTVVKNSEGNYTLGRSNEWSVNNTVTSVKRISENQNNIYNIELNNGMTPGYTLTRNSNIRVNIDENEVNKHLEVSKIVKGDIYGGHTIDSVDHIFTNSYTKDPYNPEYKIVSFEEKYPGIYQLEYKAPARTSAGEVVKNEGKIQYKNKILNKTVFDSEIYKTEELTKEVTKEVKRVITQDDVTRAFQNVKKQVSLDIKINNIKVRAYIKANEKTGGVEIKNYHFDVQE